MGSVNTKLHQRLLALKNRGKESCFCWFSAPNQTSSVHGAGGEGGSVAGVLCRGPPPLPPAAHEMAQVSMVFDAEPVRSLPAVRERELPRSCCSPCCSLPHPSSSPLRGQKVGDGRDAFSPPFGDGVESPPPPIIPTVITPLVMANRQFGFAIDGMVGYIVRRVIISFWS